MPDTCFYEWNLSTETLDSIASSSSRIIEPTLCMPETIDPEKHAHCLNILNEIMTILNEPDGDSARRSRIPDATQYVYHTQFLRRIVRVQVCVIFGIFVCIT